MSFIVDLVRKPPRREDVVYFLRAALSRPGDIPWILRREAAERRAKGARRQEDDPLGLDALIEGWEAVCAVGVFRAPPGTGARLTLTRASASPPQAALTALQMAGGASFLDMETDPVFPALSLEAARLGLAQGATEPARAAAARRGFVERADVSPDLRAALRELADQPIGAA